MRGRWIVIGGAGALAAALAACGGGASNELPQDFRGRYPMTRLLGTDNVVLTVGPNGIAMEGCDVNCPEPTITFTSITCPQHDTCNVSGPDCTGTIELWSSSSSLEITLQAVPGAPADQVERRQVQCFQYSGSTDGRQ